MIDFDLIYGYSCMIAMALTIPLCVIWEIHRSKYGGEDCGFIVCFIAWALGPIAVICYIVGIILGIRQLYISKKEDY